MAIVPRESVSVVKGARSAVQVQVPDIISLPVLYELSPRSISQFLILDVLGVPAT